MSEDLQRLYGHLVDAHVGVRLEGEMEETADERLLLDKQDLVQLLRRFDGLRVRLQLKVVAEEE